ncbi:MAG: serine/threonine protein kinase [Blastocatellia bacterium]|nr:serine/threonine protein kinase [Blastocatellia bacterium]
MKYCPICKNCYDDEEERCLKDRIFLVDAFPGSRVVASKYRIDALIGQGGMGAVYRATHLELDRVIALKVVLPDFVSSNETLERFRREARATARLNHPSVITIYDFGVLNNGRAYLAMELLSGRSLREDIEREEVLTPKRVLELYKPICEAVQAAHNAGVIHRDLKPDNIVIETSEAGLEHIKVVDFGIAKLKEQPGIQALTLTGPGLVMGTPHYMSPEQCKGEDLDVRSDIYSLGVMLYEMLSGHVPFDAPTPSAVIIQHAIDPPRRLSLLKRDISPELEAVVMKALSKNRLARQQTVIELYEELDKAVNNPSATVSQVPPRITDFLSTPPSPVSRFSTPKESFAAAEVSRKTDKKKLDKLDTVTDQEMIPDTQQSSKILRVTHQTISGISMETSSRLEQAVNFASSPSATDQAANQLDREANELKQLERDSSQVFSDETYGVVLREVATLIGHEHVIKSLDYTPDGKYLVSGSSDGTIKIWDLQKKMARGALVGHELSVNAVAISPDGQSVASASSDGTVKLWNLVTESEIASFNNYEGSLRSVAFAPSGKYLALSNEANIEVWEIETRKRLAEFTGHVRLVEAVEFTRDGSTVISGGVDETVRFWDLATNQPLGMINCRDHCINTLSSSVDGILATGGKDGKIHLWDVASRTDLATFEGHTESVRSLAFSTRGDYLISGDWSGIVKLWDTATGAELASIGAHDGAVMAVAFSPDEKQIATAGYDQEIKLWTIEGLEEG